MKYIDAHCHLQFPEFDADREEIISEMANMDMSAIVVGVDLESSLAAVELSKKHKNIFASVGLHPNYTDKEDFSYEKFLELAKDEKVVAIGECGFDFFRSDKDSEERQEKAFMEQVELARGVKKPLMIHARPSAGTQDAYEKTLFVLNKNPEVHAHMHFFVGDVEIAGQLIEAGASFSFPGVVTFTEQYDEVLKLIPADKIFSETDSPYAAPKSVRGKRNDPRNIPEIVEVMAEKRGEEVETFREQITQNAESVFAIK